MFKNKTEKNRNDKKCSQTGITVKIHTNYDDVRPTTIMLRSIAASTSSSEITSAALQVKNSELDLMSFPMRWVEGHISHNRLVLWRCHKEQSSCSCEFGCRSLIKNTHLEQFVFKLPCWKTRLFLWATIRPDFNKYFTFTFCFRDLKRPQAKKWISGEKHET